MFADTAVTVTGESPLVEIASPNAANRWRLTGTTVQRSTDGGGRWEPATIASPTRSPPGTHPRRPSPGWSVAEARFTSRPTARALCVCLSWSRLISLPSLPSTIVRRRLPPLTAARSARRIVARRGFKESPCSRRRLRNPPLSPAPLQEIRAAPFQAKGAFHEMYVSGLRHRFSSSPASRPATSNRSAANAAAPPLEARTPRRSTTRWSWRSRSTTRRSPSSGTCVTSSWREAVEPAFHGHRRHCQSGDRTLQVAVEPSRISVLEQNYEYDLLEPDKLLRKYVGRDVTLVRVVQRNGVTQHEEVKARLLSYNTRPSGRSATRS